MTLLFRPPLLALLAALAAAPTRGSAAPTQGSAAPTQGSAAAGEGPSAKTGAGQEAPVVRLQGELRAIMEEASPLRQELENLSRTYEDGARLPESETRRGELRLRLQGRYERLVELQEEYDEQLRAHNMGIFSHGLARILSRPGGEAPAELTAMAGREIGGALTLQELRHDANDFRRLTLATLEQDESSWRQAGEARVTRRRRRRTAVMVAVAALLLAAGAFVLRRRKPADLERVSPVELARSSADSGPCLSGPASVQAPGDEGALPPGAILGGNFRLERELGRGGMGVVYEALDLALQRKVAVKRMRSTLGARERDLEHFLSEARVVAALKHPNIVEIHGILREGAELCLVFELVAGRSLDALLDERPRLPLAEARGLIRQAAAALDYAHDQRVIHRDLTPGNIMVAGSGLVKVMDFGLAHQASLSAARLTRAESWGTPPYMAPEQEVGSVSRESDVFSLGVCLYEMLTGRLPFEGPNYLAQKRERRYPTPSSVAGLGPALDTLMARALSPEPGERFPSAGELAAALEGA